MANCPVRVREHSRITFYKRIVPSCDPKSEKIFFSLINMFSYIKLDESQNVNKMFSSFSFLNPSFLLEGVKI